MIRCNVKYLVKGHISIYLCLILAARTFLAIQNLCVSICALWISSFLWTYGGNSGLSPRTTNISPFMLNETYKEQPLLLGNYSNTTNEPVSALSNLPSFETAKLVTIIGVITFSSIARLASSGTVIILQKDWIVVIADNDTDYLASMFK